MECFFCHSKKPPLIQSSRISSFREASSQREDGLGEKLDENADYIVCHKNCMSTYCSKQHIQRVQNKTKRKTEEIGTGEHERKRLRGPENVFNFREQCFFCGQDCTLEPEKKNPTRWRKAYLCRTADEKGRKISREEILKHCKERGDSLGREVEFRVSSTVGDLHAADARYHRDCYARFYTNPPKQSCASNTTQDSALDMLVHEMQSNKTCIWNSVEVHEQYIQLGGTDRSRRALVTALYERLHPDLLILSSPGVASILVFRSCASNQLRIVDDNEDCNGRAISCLASTIRSECPQPDRQFYPVSISRQQVMTDCSPTLLALLAAISPSLDSTLPAAMIGHIVTSAVNRYFTSLQLAVSVLLTRQRKVMEQLHDFGVTSTYDELRRFRISAATAMASVPRGLAQFDSSRGLVQVVADNFDTQISSQNGNKSTHGLAMILTQANYQKPQLFSQDHDSPRIKRLSKTETKVDNLTLGEVKIHRYMGPKKPPMPKEVCQRLVPSLAFLAAQHVSLNRAATEDLTFFKQVLKTEPRPEYSGFNTQLARNAGKQPRPKTAVVYSPFLDMIPAEPDTMKTAMVEAQRLTNLTGQEWTVFTNDQQLYKEAVHITWVDREMFKKFIPRLGGMHMLMSFVGCIGSLMEGSGLEDILASTFAGVPKLLSGKKYPQNVRALRILVEEILRPVLSGTEVATMSELIHLLTDKSNQSNTAKLWVQCLIDPVFIMMAFTRAEREGDWPLHLYAVEKMIPYFFAAGHFNYARYGLFYLRSMQCLHPDVRKKFMVGEHVMHHQDGLWNGLWSDQFIETTYMRYGHGPSGIIGSTLNESTLAIWAFSHSTLAQISNDMETLKEGQVDAVITTHKEERQSRMNEDAADRAKIQESLSNCIDILDASTHPETGLVNVYSGRIIDDPTVNVHEAVKIGTEEQKAFEGKWPESFHLKLKRRIKNIASVVKTQTKIGKDTKCLDTEFIYARVLGIMASSRETVSIETLFSHELAPLPTALFDETGDMRTTSKAVLKNKIKIVSSVRNQPSPSILVLDGCAILWTVPWPAAPAQVSAFINAAIATILRRADNISVLHVVFDRYFALSTKACCRTGRQKGTSRVFTLTEDTPLPKQSLVLNVTDNKKQVIKLIVDRLCSMQPPLDTEVVITGSDPQPVHMGSGLKEPPLHHEEADVLMAYHVINEASSGHTAIKVISDDTDVLVILAHHMHKQTGGLSNRVALFMESCSSGPSHNVISVNDVVSNHQNIMPNLLAAHALTGCDTVSSFSGIGKASVLKTLTKFNGQLKLGNLTASKEEVTESCLQFVCLLYREESANSLNTVRASCFKKKIAGKRHLPPKLSSLPPTMAPFRVHCQRANYQVALWEAAGEPTPPHLDPLNYGYEVKQSTLRPTFGLESQLPAPDEVLNLVSCSCKAGCSSSHCTCTKLSLTCTVFCKCKGSSECRNPVTVSVNLEEQDS